MRTIHLFTITAFVAVSQLASFGAESKRPNVVVILADDLGWADIGAQKEAASVDVSTPNIDQLLSEGMRFTNGYVPNATCGPSRASLLTGRICSRFGMEDNSDIVPPTSEIMIPAIIRKAGYKSGIVGKWHLGEKADELPRARGFDEFYGFPGGNHDYYAKALLHNGEEVEFEGYLTDVLAEQSADFIRQHRDEPFFLYAAFNAPHSPMQAPERLVRRVVQHQPKFQPVYERMKLKTGRDGFPNFDLRPYKGTDIDQEIMRLVYCAMVFGLDDAVGKIMNTINEAGIRENTLVVFLSDNGAALARPNDLGGVNLPLRSGKGTIFDGGLRVVFGASWPGTIPEGHDYHGIVNSVDLFTTTVELAGASVPEDRVIDGVNFIPYLTGEKQGNPHDTFFFRRKARDSWSLRSGDFKWVVDRNSRTGHRGVLYNLAEDVSESQDVTLEHRDKRRELSELFENLTADLPDPIPAASHEE